MLCNQVYGSHRLAILCLSCMLLGPAVDSIQAKDYFLVLAGGYSPAGNQASLEANVFFFRDVLREQHAGAPSMTTFFADGDDRKADLQYAIEIPPSTSPATALLTSLASYRGNSNTRLRYRNHQVDDISGALQPRLVRAELERLAGIFTEQDRLFVYVTAHGAKAKGDNAYNTSISCWDRQTIKVSELESWLDELPSKTPVIMVMAQCYCGGFAHTIFDKATADAGLSPHRRVGFFAQQHDLAAAGCRPDIRNDEEYSSYFWGAMAGRTRSGTPIQGADLDGDGGVSLSEAHAYAVLASQTIDIPLRSTEALLRTYSRIGNYDHRRAPKNEPTEEEQQAALIAAASHTELEQAGAPATFTVQKPIVLAEMAGSLADLASRGTRAQAAIVEGLADQLQLDLALEAPVVFERYAAERDQNTPRRRRRGSSGRREFLKQISEEFPELADRDNWKNAEALRPENQQSTYERFVSLEGYERYQAALESRQRASQDRRDQEMREVKYQRLVNTLEAIVLAENLPKLAPAEVVQHYRMMLALEQSSLNR